jgi:NAD(P)-dependent dehydrogenase (short-subunit alcohol dehydrogenase family)
MKTYLIVGASSGIGKALSAMLAKSGNMVYGTYNKSMAQTETENIKLFPLDVVDENLNLDFLPEKLEGIAYCPGSITLKPFERIKAADLMSDFQLQVLGAVRVLQAALPKLRNGENPSVVLFSTVAVQVGLPYHSVVSVSKGAIEGLTKALAAEYAPRVRVNCIAPSLTDTPLGLPFLNTDQKRDAANQRHPLKRVGNPDDIAGMAEFLISEKSGWITGQVIHVDGGYSSLRV